MYARLGRAHVMALPGRLHSVEDAACERLFDRLACGLPVTPEWLGRCGVGGLVNARREPRRAR